MCGITGYYLFKSDSSLNQEVLKKMSDKIAHRGPDYQGVFTNEKVGLAHNRLSIIDLSADANQPMVYENLSIIFNGEIYNFIDLKKQLIAEGFHFKTRSDTEVILVAYKKWGIKAFEKLNGIFAFSIYDSILDEMIIVRDRFGVKPLYYQQTESSIIFSSEIKAILASGKVDKSMNYQSLYEYMWFVSPMGTNTIYSSVEKVAPGEYIHIKNNQLSKHQYWNIDFNKTLIVSEDEAVNNIRILLEKAVERQLVSDVPVSVFLSGGIDSSAITSFAAKHYSKQLHSYSVEFDFNRHGNSELAMAKIIAEKNNTLHHEVMVSSKNLEDVVSLLAYHHDEPFADAANIPLYLLTKTLKKDIKVVLQGDGGDELFGGYRYYNLMNNSSNYFLPALFFKYTLGQLNLGNETFQKFKRISNSMSERDLAEQVGLIITGATHYNKPISCLSKSIQEECKKHDPFEALKSISDYKNVKDKLQYLHWVDLKTILPNDYLEKVDKSTMANSIEVRVPFLDYELADYVMSLSGKMKLKNGEKKYLLKKALRGIVPDTILDAPKRGFGVPCDIWLRTGLNKMMKEVLNDQSIVNSGLFNYQMLNHKIKEHDSKKANHGMELWRCFNLALWYKQYMV